MSKAKPSLDPAIHRVRVEKLTIFEITEGELEALERGSPESLFLNMGVATSSVAISFLVTLTTTSIANLGVFCVFVILCVVGSLAGITFGLLWWRSRTTVRNVSREIRSRMVPEGIQEDEGEKPQSGE